jgi:hypothetical protein
VAVERERHAVGGHLDRTLHADRYREPAGEE